MVWHENIFYVEFNGTNYVTWMFVPFVKKKGKNKSCAGDSGGHVWALDFRKKNYQHVDFLIYIFLQDLKHGISTAIIWQKIRSVTEKNLKADRYA